MKQGEAWAICFYLKTQAKGWRYVERQENLNIEPTRLMIVEEIVDAPSEEHTGKQLQFLPTLRML
jgi:hypothetical protein